MVIRISTHVANSDRQPVSHANDAKLGYGILLKELCDEFYGISYREKVPRGTEVFLGHCYREVDHNHKVADNPSL